MSKIIERDVIVVGAGPGGAACAGYLAKDGIDVLLLDKEKFPRDKPCGEGQSHETYLHYQLLGCYDEYMSMMHPLAGLDFYGPNGQQARREIVEGVCPRRALDTLVRNQAEKLGAEVIEDCWVYDLIKEDGQVKGVKAKIDGEYVELRSKIVIGADGAHSMVAKKAGMYFDGDGDDMSIAVVQRCHYSGVTGLTDAIELFFDPQIVPGYVWIFPYEKHQKGFCNVGIGYYRKQYESAKMDELLKIWLNRPDIKERFRNAKQVTPMQGWRIPNDYLQRHTYGDGVMLIGDAAGQNTPASGEGISLAMNAGFYAYVAAKEALKKNDFSKATLKIYDDFIQKWHTPYYKTMRGMLDGMTTPEQTNALMDQLVASKELRDQVGYLFSGGNSADGIREYLGMKTGKDAFDWHR